MQQEKGLVVLGLFDGMSCGRVALERAGIKPAIYFASEIDKYAIKIAQKNFPDTVQLGDVVEVRKMAEQGLFGKIDLLIGGSPCQGFSFAGKQLAFDDPRSALFFEYVKTLKALQRDNPDIKFLLENVRMKKEYLDVITEQLGVEPVCINSALVSAQNRVRYYWANWKIEQPEDRGILLKDILQDGVLETLYKPNDRILKQVRDEKSRPLMASMYKGIENNGQTSIKVCNVNPSGRGMNGCVYHTEGKSPTLTTNKGEGVKITGGQMVFQKLSDNDRVKGVTEVKNGLRPHQGDARKSGISELGISELGILSTPETKSSCITSTHAPKITGGRMVGRRLNPETGKRDDYNPKLKPEQRVETREDGKAGCVTTVTKDSLAIIDEIYYRKLTPIECERLMSLPDNYTEGVSNSQRYKMNGNGWETATITHIFIEMIKSLCK